MVMNGLDKSKSVDELINENSGLVFTILKKYFMKSYYDEDVRQVGMIGLWKAIESFDESKGFKFATYATTIILNEIRMYFRQSEEFKRTKHNCIVDSIELDLGNNFKDKDDALHIDSIIVADTLPLDTNLRIEETMKSLTERQIRIVQLKARGLNQKEISDRIGICQGQISRELKEIHRKVFEHM